jgi:hypothetical protein
MIATKDLWSPAAEEFLAEVTAAAYHVALRHGLKGPFLDVELELWRRLREVLEKELFTSEVADAAARQEEAVRWPA